MVVSLLVQGAVPLYFLPVTVEFFDSCNGYTSLAGNSAGQLCLLLNTCSALSFQVYRSREHKGFGQIELLSTNHAKKNEVSIESEVRLENSLCERVKSASAL